MLPPPGENPRPCHVPVPTACWSARHLLLMATSSLTPAATSGCLGWVLATCKGAESCAGKEGALEAGKNRWRLEAVLVSIRSPEQKALLIAGSTMTLWFFVTGRVCWGLFCKYSPSV